MLFVLDLFNKVFSAMQNATLRHALLLSCTFAGAACAQTDVAQMVRNACQPEIAAYCSAAMPGEGRMLACFYAHEDKLSGTCVDALYDGVTVLASLVSAVSYVAENCATEIDTICAGAQFGGGQVAACLLDNKPALGQVCVSAIDEVGLRRE